MLSSLGHLAIMVSKLSLYVFLLYMLTLSERSLTQDIGETPTAVARIGGGTLATPAQLPYVVSIRTEYPRLMGAKKCTGTILTTDWVLTACHCVPSKHDTEEYHINLLAGTIDATNTKNSHLQKKKPVKIITHDFNRKSGRGDVALIKVDTPYVFNAYVKPIALVDEPLKSTEKVPCTMMGFGEVKTGPNNRLFYIKGHAIKCSSIVSGLPPYADTEQVCVKVDQSGTSICGGDSGSPLVCADRLAGVASKRIGDNPRMACGDDSRNFALYMSTYHYGPWIREHIGKVRPQVRRNPGLEETRNAGCSAHVGLIGIGLLALALFVC